MSGLKQRKLIRLLAVAVVVIPLQVWLVAVLTSAGIPLPALWTSRMTMAELQQAVPNIHAYPVAYRHSLVRALPPGTRARAWRENTAEYLRTHRDLTVDQRTLISELMAADSEEAFVRPRQAEGEWKRLGDRTREVLGPEAFKYLFTDLGPPDDRAATVVSALPWRIRLEDFARRHLLLRADDGSDCDCKMGWQGDCDPGVICNMLPACKQVENACGFKKSSWCDGTCGKKEG